MLFNSNTQVWYKACSLIVLIFSTVLSFAQTPDPTPAQKGPKWGFKDEAGNWVVKAKYKEVRPFSDGYAAVSVGGQKWIYIDRTGKQAVPRSWNYGDPISEGYFFDLHKGPLSVLNFYDLNGNPLLDDDFFKKTKFSIINASPFQNGVAEIELTHMSKSLTRYLTKDGKIHNSAQLARTHLISTDQLPKTRVVTPVTVEVKEEYAVNNDEDLDPNVDINIPVVKAANTNTFALIIANEDYKRESDVEFALNDGRVFRKYCRSTLGLPESNVHMIENATLNDIRAELNWISKVAAVYNGEAKLILYYAGHGMPDEATKDSYLLPVDAYGSDVSTAYRLGDLYELLSATPSVSTVIFLDACFSGAQRNGQMLAAARGIALKAKADSPKGNMIVFSASTGDETAYPYRAKSHGMFTYFLLRKLQESKGSVTLGELAEYIKTNVSRKAIVQNSKSQTPTVTVAPQLEATWSSINL